MYSLQRAAAVPTAFHERVQMSSTREGRETQGRQDRSLVALV